MRFSDYLRKKILEKYGNFRNAAKFLEIDEQYFTRRLSNKPQKGSSRKIWLFEIDEWDEKLNLSLMDGLIGPNLDRLKILEDKIKDWEKKRENDKIEIKKRGANPNVKSCQSRKKGDKNG